MQGKELNRIRAEIILYRMEEAVTNIVAHTHTHSEHLPGIENIQTTCRLIEGKQSILLIPKFTTSTNDDQF